MNRSIQLIALAVMFICLHESTAIANMKKSSVGSGGTKGFAFTTFSDGFCTISTIYDKTSSYLGVALGLTSGDIVCAGLSTQDNFQSCTAGLPSGTYVFIVTSLRGGSPFRVVANCTDQENVVSAGTASPGGIEIREIELGTAGNRLLDEFHDLAKKSGRFEGQ